ncbi:MAG: bamD [Proteobacteria bacterium]|nr:bamD [Pseudomonadota bacterium]
MLISSYLRLPVQSGIRQLGYLLRAVFMLCIGFLYASAAAASVIETIDISRVDDNAQIVIRFGTEIQYLRHGPEHQAKFLRVFFRVAKPGFQENEVMQETWRSPPSDLVPRFKLTYPELINGMLISFDKPVRYTLSPGGDARSIVITIPLPEEKKKPQAAVVPVAPVPPVSPPPSTEAAAEPKQQPAAPATKGKAKSKAATLEKKPGTDVAAVPVAPVPAGEPAGPVGGAPTQIPDAAKPVESPAPMPQEQVEELAQGFLTEAKEAFAKGDNPKAINRLNRLLGLPANRQTEPAQALMGEVREKNGEIAKARAEYELYLRLYPNAGDAARLRQRLADLPKSEPARRPVSRAMRDDKPAEWMVYGSLSSYWFSGQSRQDAGPMVKDQNTLVSSLSLNARLRDAVTDTRIVFRDTDSKNFLRENRDYNRIYSAYVERTDREVGYFVRAGRQNPNGSGVLERFDGVTGSYNLGSDWRMGAVAGTSVEFKSTGNGWFNLPANKQFYGGNVEYLAQLGRPGASLYAIEQTLDGYLNRRAVGSEFRYFDGQFNAFGVLDYDVLYKGLNIGMIQGNYIDRWGNNYFINYDYRKSPTYSLSNALPNTYALGITTVNGLVSNFGIEQSRQVVVDSTPTMQMFGTGVTIPVGDKWQFGFDYRTSKVSGANAVLQLNQVCKSLGFNALDPNDPICVGGPLGDVPISQMCAGTSYDPNNNTCAAGQSSQGRTDTFTTQAIGTNLFVTGGVGVAMASFYSGGGFSGQNYGLNYIFPFAEVWRLEGNLRYFSSKSDNGSGQTNFSPAIKLGYQWRSTMFVESEIGFSDQKTTGINSGSNKREYLYLGLRWDFR